MAVICKVTQLGSNTGINLRDFASSGLSADLAPSLLFSPSSPSQPEETSSW